MAVSLDAAQRAGRISRFRLCSTDARALARFYEKALGFQRLSEQHLPAVEAAKAFDVGGSVLRIMLALGEQHVELVEFVDQPGRPYPLMSVSSDLVFQHFAMVVNDIDAALRQLSSLNGWTAISVDGPQPLPPSSGGVTAFKFRDPQGHPLELLQFPVGGVPSYWKQADASGPFLGIDHSAISVADTARSMAFYEAMGLHVSHRSLNAGAAQGRLDGLHEPVVEVTALSAGPSTPHLELLCYRGHGKRAPLQLQLTDIAATCVILARACESSSGTDTGGETCQLRDPDGHWLSFEPESSEELACLPDAAGELR